MTLMHCDVDGVLADFVGGVLNVLNAQFGRTYTHADVDQYDIQPGRSALDPIRFDFDVCLNQPTRAVVIIMPVRDKNSD